MIIFGIDIRIYFLLFMVYSIAGWLIEVICKLIQYKRFINRGFLIGPYCPIYGYGALLITFLLRKYVDDPVVLFVMSVLICGILEYVTSYIMEKLFKARWWDYSKRKFNLNGRICLGTIIPFGILGLLIMYIFNPFILGKLENLPEIVLNILSISLFVVYIVDNIISLTVTEYIKTAEKIAFKDEDNTEEFSMRVKQILKQKSILHRRLVNAYPKLEAIKIKINQKKAEIKKEVEEQKKEIIKKAEDIKNKKYK